VFVRSVGGLGDLRGVSLRSRKLFLLERKSLMRSCFPVYVLGAFSQDASIPSGALSREDAFDNVSFGSPARATTRATAGDERKPFDPELEIAGCVSLDTA
jgi:hypothetical protein